MYQINDQFNAATRQFADSAAQVNRLALENAEYVLGLQLVAFQQNTSAAFHSVHFSCPVPFRDAVAEAAFEAGTGNVANGTSSLTAGFINGPEETGVAAYQGLPDVSSFFQQVDYIGGVRNAGDTWWQGWTCGLTADASC